MEMQRDIKLKTDTAERKEDHEFVEKTASAVRSWPRWMHGDYSDLEQTNQEDRATTIKVRWDDIHLLSGDRILATVTDEGGYYTVWTAPTGTLTRIYHYRADAREVAQNRLRDWFSGFNPPIEMVMV